MHWKRRRDLEGGKELGVWLLVDDGTVIEELYVESHAYRGEGFDLYTATPDGEWTHEGAFDDADAAFEAARDRLEASPHPVAGR